MKRYK